MRILVTSVLVMILVLTPIASAQQQKGLIEGISDTVGMFFSNMFYVFKAYVINPIVGFSLKYFFHNEQALETHERNAQKEEALQTAYNQQYGNPECCTPANCIINKSQSCATLCEKCSKVISDINAYFV